ncbi:ZP domain-containing protein-like [Strongylocentrotus purpuratus]|uniref:ZP domain-containing protein n=1 Tax=Strongylocentrotus purpuratus TaxID=7668 RepID=A0A7M7N3Z1_STRPU|nr:ZP domain-containing protein-like [Strongylocentrotus purpuratus]
MRKLYSSDPSFSKFVIDAFTFIEENTQVFIHCEVLICNDNDPSSRCSQGCKSRFRRGSRHTRGASSTPHLISNGPLSTAHTMHAAEAHNSDGSPVGMESSILIGVLACITCLIVATVAGVLYKLPARRMSNIYTIEASSEGQRKL